jgi:hypothetical protein
MLSEVASNYTLHTNINMHTWKLEKTQIENLGGWLI